ncbi:ROK family transcriptional regulator [Mycetocola zhadangensis]|uniref:ROK family transcriptional regulator n=1 Tax=Mycetocola zhadangensis TaxID=1164595 RepID=A0A3L7J150_9MICO|nr:ROK family transcriptional regulator [Mycetocola zhadangensis]RLQ84228.1 ROK family transcriptional regulator [Mycetocola zhadangensis]GGE94908.1 MarR family transcriptional regulator [Mycetocola zhadangensis]
MQQDVRLPLEGLQHAVAIDVLLHGPLSRKQLAARLGVSPGTLTRVAGPLLEAGLLVERALVQRSSSGRPGIGRPEEPLDLELGRDFYVGVKITENTLHCVVTTLRAQLVTEISRSLASLEPSAVADQITDVVGELSEEGRNIRALGVSLGGQVSRNSLVLEAPLLGWSDVDLGALLKDRMDLPVVVDNDVLSLVRAERWFGAAKDSDHFALITIGAGIGYGLVAGSGILEGPDPGLSTITHFPLGIGGGVCSQGHTGCAESLLTTKALLSRARLALDENVTHDELLALADTNPAAASIVETAAYGLGKLIASVANLALPEKIILTGDGVDLALANREALDRGISDHRNRRATPIDLEIQTVSFAEWARGAAATAIETFVVGR